MEAGIRRYKKELDYSYTLGPFPTFELLEARPDLAEEVCVSPGFNDAEKLFALCKKLNVPCRFDQKTLDRISNKEIAYAACKFRKFSSKLKSDAPHVLLVNPSDMGNLGTIQRTMLAFGVRDLAVVEPCADVFNPKAVRATMGALFKLRVHVYPDFETYRREFPRRDLFPFMLYGKEVIEMTDLHTHILPGMDDGAANVDMSLQMLQKEAEQGVKTEALTPHFNRTREHTEDFLRRRSKAMQQLSAAVKEQKCPRLILGAEVAWAPGMADWPELEQLCYADSRILLVELPFTPWNDEMFRQLYSLEGRCGVLPMIAHVERYFGRQEKKKLRALLEMGLPMQVSACGLNHIRGRRTALQLLQMPDCVLISDCHNLTDRPPDMAGAMAVLTKKLGKEAAAAMANAGSDILYD